MEKFGVGFSSNLLSLMGSSTQRVNFLGSLGGSHQEKEKCVNTVLSPWRSLCRYSARVSVRVCFWLTCWPGPLSRLAGSARKDEAEFPMRNAGFSQPKVDHS